jgi:hypothetical protein
MTTKAKSKFGAAMFDSIKAALNKTDSSEGQYKDIMKFPAGHTYTVRLLPNLENPEKSIYHHWVHGWTSSSNGKYVSALGLQTFNERDPINELRWKLWKEWKDANPNVSNKEYNGKIAQKEQWLVNILVVDDPHTPENNGKIKILRMGPQIKKLIDDAVEGDRSEEFGMDIWNPTVGYDLKIKAEQKGEYTTFESSYFTTKSKVTLTEQEAEELCGKLHDLEQVYSVKSYDELQDMLNEHYFNGGATKSEPKKSLKEHKKVESEKPPFETEEDDDDIPMSHDSDFESDDDIDSLLAELDKD